jgi:hypothetical protein
MVFHARICKLVKEPRNRFPAWRAGTTTLFDVPARQATQAGGIDSLESIPGLLKRFQIWAPEINFQNQYSRWISVIDSIRVSNFD